MAVENIPLPSPVLHFLEGTEQRKELAERIRRKRNEFSAMEIDPRLNATIREYLPEVFRLGLPVAFSLPERDIIALVSGEQSALDALKKINTAFGSLPWTMKGQLQELVTKVTITGHMSLEADHDDFSIKVPLEREANSDVHTRYISHEVGHLMHAAILLTDDEYQKEVNRIDAGSDKKMLKPRNYRAAGKFIWTPRPELGDSVETILYDANGKEIWRGGPKENPGDFEDKWDVYLRRYQYSGGEILGYRMQPPGPVSFLFGDQLTPESEMTDEAIEEYVRGLKLPREGYITPYAAADIGDMRTLGSDLGYEGEFECNVEEVSEIVEIFYSEPWNFTKYMLMHKDTDDFVSFDEETDDTARYPRLRKKVRLLAKYGVFPELEKVLHLYDKTSY
jgi:hypothetical protein